jgi:nucleoside-triphosphatase
MTFSQVKWKLIETIREQVSAIVVLEGKIVLNVWIIIKGIDTYIVFPIRALYMVPVKVAISGQPGTGKTKTVLRIAKMVEEKFNIGGFTTHPIEEEGEIVGYNLKDFITQEEELSASVRWDVKPKVPGRNPESTPLGIRLDSVNRIATASVQKAIEESDLILVDEVGKLVSESKEFSAVLKEALKCGKPMLITMHKRSRNPLLQSIRKRDDLRTLEVTPINSAILPSKAVNILKTGMV